MANTNGMRHPMTAKREFKLNGKTIKAGDVFDAAGANQAREYAKAGDADHGDTANAKYQVGNLPGMADSGGATTLEQVGTESSTQKALDNPNSQISQNASVSGDAGSTQPEAPVIGSEETAVNEGAAAPNDNPPAAKLVSDEEKAALLEGKTDKTASDTASKTAPDTATAHAKAVAAGSKADSGEKTGNQHGDTNANLRTTDTAAEGASRATSATHDLSDKGSDTGSNTSKTTTGGAQAVDAANAKGSVGAESKIGAVAKEGATAVKGDTNAPTTKTVKRTGH